MVVKINWKQRYTKAFERLKDDKTICKKNRDLFIEFFEFEERKLKRLNGLTKLDDSTYKTLYGYTGKVKTINQWFQNKPLKELTKEDIQQVYDDLEDGKILNTRGEPYKSRQDYYSKFFKSKLFKMAGKYEIACEVIEYSQVTHKEVSFIRETEFKKMVEVANKPVHRLLLWLAFDIGENINSLLQLKKRDFYKQTNEATRETEFKVHLRKEILKRTRIPRSVITNYNETVTLIDQYISSMDEDEFLFKFDHRNALKIINRMAERSSVKCEPTNKAPTWKDLRSGMACDLLNKGWTTDEVKSRLGHKPSSKVIDKYINYLAIGSKAPKRKVQQFKINELQDQLEEMRHKEKLQSQRIDELLESQKKMNQLLEGMKTFRVKEMLDEYLRLQNKGHKKVTIEVKPEN